MWLTAGIAAVVTLIAVYPLIAYYFSGWVWKKEDILVSITDTAKATYLEVFHRIRYQDQIEASREFKRLYNKWYGRRHLILPIVILAVIIFVQACLVAQFALSYILPNDNYNYIKFELTATAAFVGAYIFVVSDFVLRNRRRDLTSSDILLSSIRLAGAIAIGYAFASSLKDAIGPLIAFAVGAFPLPALQVAVKRMAQKQVAELQASENTPRDPVGLLSGVDPPIADRISDCGITTIAQLAYSDPIQLAMQSNLGFNYVSDLVCQSLAWIYFAEDLNKLRPLGIRGAIEVINFLERLSSAEEIERTRAQAALKAMASTIGLPKEALLNTFQEIATDPYAVFLWECWNSTDAAPEEAK